MNVRRTPFKPVNRDFTAGNLSEATLDRLMDEMSKQRKLKKLGTPNQRFCAAVEHIVANKTLPPLYEDGMSFIRLALEVLSAKRVKKECQSSFETFLSVVHLLPKEVRESISSRSFFLYRDTNPVKEDAIKRLTSALHGADLEAEEKAKIEEVKNLERMTAVPREKVETRYPAAAAEFDDLPHIKAFLESGVVETRLYGYNGIAHARKEEEALRARLPKGSLMEALGKGKKAYIALEKPCFVKWRDWNWYCDNMRALEKARSELKKVRANKRSFEGECEYIALKRPRTNAMW